MMFKAVIYGLLFSNFFVLNSLPVMAKSNVINIGYIKNYKLLKILGTYCDFQLPKDPAVSQRDILMSAYYGEYNSKGLMNINGQDLLLARVNEFPTKKGSIATYRNGQIKVKVNYIKTLQESEGASYDAIITIHIGKQKKTLKVKGYCGI